MLEVLEQLTTSAVLVPLVLMVLPAYFGMIFFLESVFNAFTHELLTLMGRESAVAMVWMFVCLVIRATALRFSVPLPLGLVFAFPLLAQKVSSLLGCSHPLLVVRVMEGLMGRTQAKHLTILIPAHFVGHIIGAVAYASSFGALLGMEALQPIDTHSGGGTAAMGAMIVEMLIVAVYAGLQLVMPELLAVNGMSRYWLSAFFLPLFLHRGMTFNPCAVYALWFVGGYGNMQPQHVVAPFLGSLVASVLCTIVTPDDKKSWRAVKQ
jgi:hypothetical protein